MGNAIGVEVVKTFDELIEKGSSELLSRDEAILGENVKDGAELSELIENVRSLLNFTLLGEFSVIVDGNLRDDVLMLQSTEFGFVQVILVQGTLLVREDLHGVVVGGFLVFSKVNSELRSSNSLVQFDVAEFSIDRLSGLVVVKALERDLSVIGKSGHFVYKKRKGDL